MRAIVVPKYIRYVDSETLQHKWKRKRIVSIVYERTLDHIARYIGTNPNGTPTTDIRVAHAFLPPDLFIGRGNAAQQKGQASFEIGTDAPPHIPTIDTIYTSRRYTIALVGTEPRSWCGDAFHLTLTPKGDPLRDNLRDLWIDRTTFRICEAKAVRKVRIGSPVDALMTIRLRRDGYVSSYLTTATGRMFGFPYTLSETDHMTRPTALSVSPTF